MTRRAGKPEELAVGAKGEVLFPTLRIDHLGILGKNWYLCVKAVFVALSPNLPLTRVLERYIKTSGNVDHDYVDTLTKPIRSPVFTISYSSLMPPKKKKSPARLKQTTLINLTTLSPTRTRFTQALSSHPGKQNNADDSSSEDIGALKFEAEMSMASDPETADKLNFGGVRRKRLSRIVDDSDSEHDSRQDLASSSSTKPSTRRRRKVTEENGGTIGEDDKPSKRRRLLKGRRARMSPSEEPDEDERFDEVDDKCTLSCFIYLDNNSTDFADILDNRFRARDKKTAFQRNLERLQCKITFFYAKHCITVVF